MKEFSAQGYSGLAIEYPLHGSTVDEMVDTINRVVKEHKFIPPVLIAHSMSSFVAQKYLESYALSGLVLVNPLPPYSTGVVLRSLQSRWEKCLETAIMKHKVVLKTGRTKSVLSTAVSMYYQLDQNAFPHATTLVSEQLSRSYKNTVPETLPNSSSDASFPLDIQPFSSSASVLRGILAGKERVILEPGWSKVEVLNFLS
jgi:pimeloyl-ACP methyl ester carboxylesterase